MVMMRELEETVEETVIKEETALITDDKTNLNVKDLNALELELNVQGKYQSLRNSSFRLEMKTKLNNKNSKNKKGRGSI